MQQSATAAPSPASSGFAGLLAALADPERAPGRKFPPARDLDGLEEDIATLSYEHALRANARYRPDHQSDKLPSRIPDQLPGPPAAAPPPSPEAAEAAPVQLPLIPRESQPAESRLPAAFSTAPPAEARKCASVTVRLRLDESEQLRQRAAEAGMTVSAYLRSCAFEVETLRAQVKRAVAEMRRPAPPPARTSLWSRLWKAGRPAAATPAR